MAGVKDPAFWKRFSVAVHLDEEHSAGTTGRFELKHSDSWLARQRKKSKRRMCICYAFWISFSVFIAAVIAVVIWVMQSGILNVNPDGKKTTFGGNGGT